MLVKIASLSVALSLSLFTAVAAAPERGDPLFGGSHARYNNKEYKPDDDYSNNYEDKSYYTPEYTPDYKNYYTPDQYYTPDNYYQPEKSPDYSDSYYEPEYTPDYKPQYTPDYTTPQYDSDYKTSPTGYSDDSNYYSTSSEECIAIDSTSVCSPWGAGLFINATRLTYVYGVEKVPITNASYWDDIVRATTSGGDLQAKIWDEYLQCPSYTGEPIQYYQSYVCLTDIFYYSEGCNPTIKEIKPSFHEDVCDVYSMALKGIIDECPSLEKLSYEKSYSEETVAEIYKRRAAVLKAKDTCRELLASYKHSGYEIWGVDSDQISCANLSKGFAGNSKVATQYCDDVKAAYGQSPRCCDSVASYETKEKYVSKSQNLKAAAADASTIESPAPDNMTGTIVGATAGAAFVVVVAVALVAYVRRRPKSPKGYPISTEEHEGLTNDVEPLNGRYTVTMAYKHTQGDEIDLEIGDVVELSMKFSDGWCKGKNISTGSEGLFPLGCVGVSV
ncbi:hypothetical protein HK096_011478 [Nowakowskiella sp. JEL0078]|nr:hypothetical protein HK096_011478 [Nowakowskiella sp. JEL0078]